MNIKPWLKTFFRRRPKQEPSRSADAFRQFAGAKQSDLLSDWLVGPGISRNENIRISLPTLRARCRQLYEDDAYAKKFVELCKANIAGSEGFKVESDVVTGEQGEDDSAINRVLDEAWHRWSKPENCTPSGRLSFCDLQHSILESLPTDGEFLLRIVRGFQNEFGFAVEQVPVDALDVDYSTNLPNGTVIRMGVEMDKWFKPVAYHIKTSDPSDIWSAQLDLKRARVPARDIIHGFVSTSPRQVRGIPWLHASMTLLNHARGYQEAGLVAARVGACQSTYLEHVSQPGEPAPSYTGDAVDDDGNPIQSMEAGTVRLVPKGLKVVESHPAWPHQNHSSYMVEVLHGIASGLGVSYMSLTGNLSQASYSSGRIGLLEERENWKLRQKWFACALVRRVWNEWLEWGVLNRSIDIEPGLSELARDPKITGRRWPWVDPQKDMTAKIDALNAGLETRTRILADQGLDLEDDILRVLVKEDELFKLHGITKPDTSKAKQEDSIESDENEEESDSKITVAQD